MNPQLAQAILDSFPDAISQFGLVFCALWTALAVDLAVLAVWAFSYFRR